MLDLARARDRMVEVQITRRGVRDPHVLDSMRNVPREAFVDPGFEEFAYEDGPLPIGEGQTISQPFMVAMMIEAAEVKPGDNVLEVGAGSGYAAAVMSRIADRVYAIERHPPLGEAAARRLEILGYTNVDLRIGDGTRGWPDAAPFDAILVAAGAPGAPQALKEQLAIGGRLIIPVGEKGLCRRKDPSSPYADRDGYVPVGTLVDYTGGRSNGCTTWSPSDAQELVPMIENNPTTLYIYPESQDIYAVAESVVNGRSLLRSGPYWNSACLKEIGSPKFWPKELLEPVIAKYNANQPASPPQPLPICKGP